MGLKTNRCCCLTSCEIATDDFNRADAATLGSEWIDSAGDWSIVDNEAVKAAGASLAVFDTPHPTPSGSMIVRYNITNLAYGATYGVVVNYKDGSNYQVAEYYHGTSGNEDATISLYKVVAGSKSLIKTETLVGKPVSPGTIFNATIAEGEFCAGVEGIAAEVAGTTSLIAEGYYAGMSGDTAAPATYDDFEFRHHSATREGCGQCLCDCEGTYVPPTLNVTITGYDPRMDEVSCSGTMEYDNLNGWWYTNTIIDCGCMQVELRLTCGPSVDNPPESFSLDILQGCTDSNPDGNTGLTPESDATCSPFYLRWRVIVTQLDLACGCGKVDSGGLEPDGESGWWDIEITK